MKYEGRWIDLFQVKLIQNCPTERKLNGRVLLRTPSIDYFMSKEDFQVLKEKINEAEI